MTTPPGSARYRFEIALSFAGPHREKAREIAEILSAEIDPAISDRSEGQIFYDDWFSHEILGPDMELLLQRIYLEQTLMVVADSSKAYADRQWTQAEARAIRALRFELDTAQDAVARLRILTIRFDKGNVPGVFANEGWLDGDKEPREIASILLKRRNLLNTRRNRQESAQTKPDIAQAVLTECEVSDQAVSIRERIDNLRALENLHSWNCSPWATFIFPTLMCFFLTYSALGAIMGVLWKYLGGGPDWLPFALSLVLTVSIGKWFLDKGSSDRSERINGCRGFTWNNRRLHSYSV